MKFTYCYTWTLANSCPEDPLGGATRIPNKAAEHTMFLFLLGFQIFQEAFNCALSQLNNSFLKTLNRRNASGR